MRIFSSMMLILLITHPSGQILHITETELTAPISECVLEILHKYFTNSTKISLQTFDNVIVSDVAKRTDLPIIINADELPQEKDIDDRKPDDVSVIMDKSVDILKFLNKRKWTPKTQFLVIVAKSHASEEHMIEIFQRFWAKNIVNLLLLIAGTNVRIYTFEPFNKYDCAVHKPVLLTTWTPGQVLTINLLGITNLNGCTLNASVIDTPPSIIFPNPASKKNGTRFLSGIEGLILTEISRRLNFKLHAAEPPNNTRYGWVEPKPQGAIGAVYLKESHFACGNIAYKADRFKYLDMTTSIGCNIECISWAVPIGSKKSQLTWISLFISGFSITLWCLVTISLVSATLTFQILSKASTTDRYLISGAINAFIFTFKSSLGATVETPRSPSLKLFFCVWLWYCFVIITAYQSLLGSKLTVPQKHSNVDTFKDLLESDLFITGFRFMFQLLAEAQEEDPDIKAIGNRFKGTSYSFKEIIQKLIHDKDVAYLGTMTIFKYNVILNPDAKGLIHYMDQCVRRYFPVMLMQKNCPFTARVNQIITVLFESGIICHWRKQFVHDVPQQEPSVEKLSLNRMIGSFIILGTGLGVALIVFLGECVFYWYSSKKNERNTIGE